MEKEIIITEDISVQEYVNSFSGGHIGHKVVHPKKATVRISQQTLLVLEVEDRNADYSWLVPMTARTANLLSNALSGAANSYLNDEEIE